MTDVGGCAVGQLHRLVAFQTVQGQDLADQVRCVDRPHAQCIAGLVPDAGVRQIDLDVFDILFGVARGDLLAYRQAGGERLLSRPDLCSRGLGGGHGGISRQGEAAQVAGRVQGSRSARQRKRARESSRKGSCRAGAVAGGGLNTSRGGSGIVSAQLLQHRRDSVDPRGGSGLEIQVAVAAIMQSVCAQLGQSCIKIATRLTELRVRRITQSQNSKMQRVQFGGFLAEQELVQGQCLFGGLSLTLGGADQQQDVFTGQRLALEIGCTGESGLQAGLFQAVRQLRGYTARVARLRGGQDGDAARGCGCASRGNGCLRDRACGECGRMRGYATGLPEKGLCGRLLALGPAVARQPGQLDRAEAAKLDDQFWRERNAGIHRARGKKGSERVFPVWACVLPENVPDVICVRMDPANWIQR